MCREGSKAARQIAKAMREVYPEADYAAYRWVLVDREMTKEDFDIDWSLMDNPSWSDLKDYLDPWKTMDKSYQITEKEHEESMEELHKFLGAIEGGEYRAAHLSLQPP